MKVSHVPWNSPGQNTGVGSFSLLQQIFLTQESNQGLLCCRLILYQLSCEGSPLYLITFRLNNTQFSLVQFSRWIVSDSLWSHGLKHARPSCPSPSLRDYSNSCPLRWWCHSTISSSVVPFSSCRQSLPASGSFPRSKFFTSGVQSIEVSAWISVLPMNTQDWSPLRWMGWISLQSKGLSRVFSNTTVQKHQFFSAQLSL